MPWYAPAFGQWPHWANAGSALEKSFRAMGWVETDGTIPTPGVPPDPAAARLVKAINGKLADGNGALTLAAGDVGAVATDDARLTDTRTPKPHAHPTADVTGLDAASEAARDAARLLHLGAADRSRSSALARVAYEDTRTTQFVETWADLAAWGNATTVQVSNGRLYGNGTGDGASGASHGIALTAGQSFRAVTTIVTPATSPASGGIMVGFGKGVAGSWGVSGSSLRGLYFSLSVDKVQVCDNGIFTDPAVIIQANKAQTWTVTLTADAAFFSVVAVTADGVTEVRAQWARDDVTFPLNNLSVFNSDTRQLTGGYIGPIGAAFAIATITPRTGIEGGNRTVHWSQISGNKIKVALPANYDSRKPAPLCIAFHGNGSDENLFSDNGGQLVPFKALISAGYIVASAAYTPATSTWGAQGSLDAYYAAYQFARDNYSIGPVVLYGNSMGGIESLLTLAERRIPGIVAWAGMSPTADLAANYANAMFTGVIKSAYGIAADGSNYASKTSGHDPMRMTGDAFRSVPMLFFHATDDTAVSKAANTDALAAKVAPFAVEATIVGGITGGHSFPFAPYTAQLTAFFDRYTRG